MERCLWLHTKGAAVPRQPYHRAATLPGPSHVISLCQHSLSIHCLSFCLLHKLDMFLTCIPCWSVKPWVIVWMTNFETLWSLSGRQAALNFIQSAAWLYYLKIPWSFTVQLWTHHCNSIASRGLSADFCLLHEYLISLRELFLCSTAHTLRLHELSSACQRFVNRNQSHSYTTGPSHLSLQQSFCCSAAYQASQQTPSPGPHPAFSVGKL